MKRSPFLCRSSARSSAPFFFFTILSAAAVSARGEPGLRRLDPALPWIPEVRQKLDELMIKSGRHSPGYRREKPPVVTFDMDNTLIKNDLGDALVFWALRHDKVLQPPRKDWRLVNHYLTPEGIAALGAACSAAAEPGQPLPTSRSQICATEIATIYIHEKTTAGRPAFGPCDHRRMEPAYAFGVQLLGGHKKDEVRSYAAAALDEALASPPGSTQAVGRVGGLLRWIRIYDQQRDLVGALRDNGFDVWIVSASPQAGAEIGGERLGINKDHVIGIRLLEREGRYTYDLTGCGDIPDGRNTGTANVGNGVINYIEGKRCWINKVIFGVQGVAAKKRASDPARRPVLAVGDADTDLAMLQDAELRLVIDRNQPELLCNALRNPRGTWLIHPMFIEPLKPRVAPYPCATACRDRDGVTAACRDEDGVPIPDQLPRSLPALPSPQSSRPGDRVIPGAR